MTMRSNKKKQKKKAFTMIELIAVMAIIAILAVALVPNITGYIKEARKTQVIQQARDVIVAVEAVNIKTNNSIGDDDTIEAVLSKSGDLLEKEKITKINPDVTVKECRMIIDSENNPITLDKDGMFKEFADEK